MCKTQLTRNNMVIVHTLYNPKIPTKRDKKKQRKFKERERLDDVSNSCQAMTVGMCIKSIKLYRKKRYNH